jgi:hypothetical protein
MVRLRTAMSICLNSRFPIALYWGPEFLMLYNESLVPMVGASKIHTRWGGQRWWCWPRSARSSSRSVDAAWGAGVPPKPKGVGVANGIASLAKKDFIAICADCRKRGAKRTA